MKSTTWIRPFVVLFSLVLAAGLNFSGCNGIPLPPIPVSIPIVMDAQIVAADQDDGTVVVELPEFCNLFSAEELEALLVQAGGQQIANLVNITAVDLDSVTVTATQGDFNAFTSAGLELELTDANADPIDLGTASNAAGLGIQFEIMPPMSFDLLNDLEDDQCGMPVLTYSGEAPTSDIQFDVVANVFVITSLTP